MNKNISLFIVTLICNKSYADSSERSLGKEALESISHEYATCAAFYSIISVGFESSGDADGLATANKSTELAFNYSYEAALPGRKKEMARKVAESRTSLYIQEMGIDLEGDMSNVSILTNKHGYRCKKALENPGVFMDEVIENTKKMIYE